MGIFRRLLLTALCAGLLAGVFVAVLHQTATVPLISKAEIFEQAEHAAGAAMHEHQDAAATAHVHEAAWAPEDGLERDLYTVAADLLAGIGFALLLAAAIAVRGGEPGWRGGLLWGLAGFAVFTLAPAIGLPPETPGMAAAPLDARQLWWLVTVAATGGGLALIVFTRRPLYAVLGLLLMVLPQLYGAPRPAGDARGMVPEALEHRFVAAVIVTSLLFWAVLGAATGGFYRRFAPQAWH